jgi:hypothetical protein
MSQGDDDGAIRALEAMLERPGFEWPWATEVVQLVLMVKDGLEAWLRRARSLPGVNARWGQGDWKVASLYFKLYEADGWVAEKCKGWEPRRVRRGGPMEAFFVYLASGAPDESVTSTPALEGTSEPESERDESALLKKLRAIISDPAFLGTYKGQIYFKRYEEEKPWEQVARELGRTPGAVRVAAIDLRKALWRRLDENDRLLTFFRLVLGCESLDGEGAALARATGLSLSAVFDIVTLARRRYLRVRQRRGGRLADILSPREVGRALGGMAPEAIAELSGMPAQEVRKLLEQVAGNLVGQALDLTEMSALELDRLLN